MLRCALLCVLLFMLTVDCSVNRSANADIAAEQAKQLQIEADKRTAESELAEATKEHAQLCKQRENEFAAKSEAGNKLLSERSKHATLKESAHNNHKDLVVTERKEIDALINQVAELQVCPVARGLLVVIAHLLSANTADWPE